MSGRCVEIDVDGQWVRVQVAVGQELSAEDIQALRDLFRHLRDHPPAPKAMEELDA